MKLLENVIRIKTNNEYISTIGYKKQEREEKRVSGRLRERL